MLIMCIQRRHFLKKIFRMFNKILDFFIDSLASTSNVWGLCAYRKEFETQV